MKPFMIRAWKALVILAKYSLVGLLSIWLFFWYVSGSPMGFAKYALTYYVASHHFMKPVAKDTLFTGNLKGMMDSLGEQHSEYFNEEDFSYLMEQAEGTYSGVGLVLGKGEHGLEVVSPFEGQPAEKAGVKAGDRIMAIDGDRTDAMSINDASQRIRGEAGTTVTLTLLRDGVENDYTIQREQISLPSVKGRMLTEDIGYIRIRQFVEATGKDFGDTYKELQGKGMKKLVLDLRDNPGGLLNVAGEVGNYLLPKGTIVTVKTRSGRLESYDSKGEQDLIPLVVLVNKGSASASEVIAGAIQDRQVGTILGVNTYGKGTVQTVIPTFDGQGMKVTIAQYHTPNDRVVDGIGIQPDVELEKDKHSSEDNQLAKAIQLLEEK